MGQSASPDYYTPPPAVALQPGKQYSASLNGDQWSANPTALAATDQSGNSQSSNQNATKVGTVLGG